MTGVQIIFNDVRVEKNSTYAGHYVADRAVSMQNARESSENTETQQNVQDA